MYSLPTEITIAGETFPIRDRGDFRLVLNCFEILNDMELDAQERALVTLIVFLEGMETLEDLETLPDVQEAILEMYKFFDCGDTYQDEVQKPKLIDWKQDSNLICAAVNNVAGKEVRAETYLHWWTFMSYFMSVGESSLSTVVSIRNKIKRGKKLEKYEQEYKRENPQYFTWDSRSVSEMEDDQWILDNWNKE